MAKYVKYSERSDVLYIYSQKKAAEEEFVEVAPGINVELDRKKKVIGIEILNASKLLSLFIKKKR